MPILNFNVDGIIDDDGTYGVTFEDVRHWLPHRRWNLDVKPDQADVEAFITSVSATLGVLIRPLPTDPVMAGRLLALAHRAVTLGAAAETEASGAPERARPNDVSTYAEWLWERYQEALMEAREFADALAPGDDPAGTDPQVMEPAWSFPPPTSWASRGI